MGGMTHWVVLGGIYLCLGFTAGYWFRKWLERSWRPRFRRWEADRQRGPSPARPGEGAEPSPPDPAQERVDWIAEDGRVLGTVTRAEMRRVSATLVFHPDGRLFIQRRSPAKDVYPGLYDLCVGGTVASGETWAGNARREVGEELGIRDTRLYHLFPHRFQDDRTANLIHVFACVSAGPFTLQPEEVADGFWADEARVDGLIAEGRMCPDSTRGWALYREAYGHGRNFARDIAPKLRPLDEQVEPGGRAEPTSPGDACTPGLNSISISKVR
jgi:isopentenyldiphosphate isomerase